MMMRYMYNGAVCLMARVSGLSSGTELSAEGGPVTVAKTDPSRSGRQGSRQGHTRR